MFYLIYVSSATKQMSHDELLSLLQQSREKNLRLGITGMFLYKGGNIMQMLEGDEQTVMELYEIITKDERHKDIFTIITGDSRERSFKDWSMGFCNMDEAADLPKYHDYISEKLTLRSFQDDAQNAIRFITLFNEKNN